jgi:predicted RNA methylase
MHDVRPITGACVWQGGEMAGSSRWQRRLSPAQLEEIAVGIAERLIRMFSFAGDTILDPFVGSGSTALAAIRAGRNSISVEIEEQYLNAATRRAANEAAKRLVDCHSAIVSESVSSKSNSI